MDYRYTPEEIGELNATIDRLRAERLKLDRRIHNQRVALRQNWEILEMRAGWDRLPRAVASNMLRHWCARARECNRLRAALEKYAEDGYNGYNGSGEHARRALGNEQSGDNND